MASEATEGQVFGTVAKLHTRAAALLLILTPYESESQEAVGDS